MTTGRTERSAEEQRKRPLNRLQTVYALRAMQDEDYKIMQDEAKGGKPVAWCSGDQYYKHVFKVMGVEDLYGDSYGPVLAASGRAPFFLDLCTAEGFPDHVCGYYRGVLGYSIRMRDLGGKIPPEAPPGREWPKPNLVLAELTVCDTHFKGLQAVGQFLDAAVWVGEDGGGIRSGREPSRLSKYELDPETYEHGVEFVTRELKDFILYLERLLGKRFNIDAFEEDLDTTIKMQDLWYGITDEMRKMTPCPMNIRDHFTAMTGILFKTRDVEKATQLFKNMKDEVQYRIDNKIAGINRPEKYRVIMGSLPPWHSLNIFEQLADRGWNFVRESQHPAIPIDLSGFKDPLERCIRYYRRSLPWMIDHEFNAEEAARVKKQIIEQGFSNEMAAHFAKDYQVDGIFLHPLRSCRGSMSTRLHQYQYMEAYKVPSVLIEGDHIDQRFFDPVDAMKKFEAFEETMDYYKEVRRKAGMEW